LLSEIRFSRRRAISQRIEPCRQALGFDFHGFIENRMGAGTEKGERKSPSLIDGW
jgi:hypothetical protein